MTRVLLIIIPVLIIVLVTTVLISNLKGVQTQSTFTLVAIEGQVEHKTSDTEEYSTLSEGEIDLESGSYIRTKDYPAEVVFSNANSISIDSNTETQIKDEEGSTTISQFFGKTWHRITNLSGTDQYQVETPTTVATVRGTKFAVIFDKESEESQVLVSENEVDVQSITEIEGEKVKGETQKVTAGKLAFIKKDKPDEVSIQDIPDEIKNTPWFIRNKKLDELEIKPKNKKNVLNQIKKFHQENKEDKQLPANSEKNNKSETLDQKDKDSDKADASNILGEEFDYSAITLEGACEQMDMGEIRELRDYIASVDFPNKTQYINFLNLVIESCADNILTQEEIDKLTKEAEKIQALQD